MHSCLVPPCASGALSRSGSTESASYATVYQVAILYIFIRIFMTLCKHLEMKMKNDICCIQYSLEYFFRKVQIIDVNLWGPCAAAQLRTLLKCFGTRWLVTQNSLIIHGIGKHNSGSSVRGFVKTCKMAKHTLRFSTQFLEIFHLKIYTNHRHWPRHSIIPRKYPYHSTCCSLRLVYRLQCLDLSRREICKRGARTRIWFYLQ